MSTNKSFIADLHISDYDKDTAIPMVSRLFTYKKGADVIWHIHTKNGSTQETEKSNKKGRV